MGKGRGRERGKGGSRKREHPSELCNPQRPFLPIFLLITPMQTQWSKLTFPFTLSKRPSYLNSANLAHAISTNPIFHRLLE